QPHDNHSRRPAWPLRCPMALTAACARRVRQKHLESVPWETAVYEHHQATETSAHGGSIAEFQSALGGTCRTSLHRRKVRARTHPHRSPDSPRRPRGLDWLLLDLPLQATRGSAANWPPGLDDCSEPS